MATIREIMIEWNTASGTGKRSVMYFLSANAVATQRLAIGTFLNSIKPLLANTTAYGVAVSGREIDDQTGALVGAWADAPLHSSNGTGAGQPLPDASQALIRWQTGQIINGRFLQGRQFLPGLTTANTNVGNLLAAAQTTIQGAGNALVANVGAGLVVWRRPGPLGPGTNRLVTTCDVWSELAVLRRRRL